MTTRLVIHTHPDHPLLDRHTQSETQGREPLSSATSVRQTQVRKFLPWSQNHYMNFHLAPLSSHAAEPASSDETHAGPDALGKTIIVGLVT